MPSGGEFRGIPGTEFRGHNTYYDDLLVGRPGLAKLLIGQMLAAGEFGVALFLHSEIPMRLKSQGAPVELKYLPPFITKLSTISLAKYAPHPYSAILLYDYLISRDAQTIVADQLQREPVRKDVESKQPQFKKEQYLVVNPHTAGPKLREFQNLFEEVFKSK